ncbi:hypothetical protein KHS38_13860 [Mucilaginibacter sp. Bleaf8]|uniref:hypothetical protein n=1 Tax=Mucilaginibacter sp. Bleaf8 TaxID=2834430 RepID=UPI001BCF15B3|nr:hypothetical protein [Mucilaginibacter sp. Bleaf8]MBS7565493.1 hypothetical protein [Mucilaginibacter sp. Bleaf8]
MLYLQEGFTSFKVMGLLRLVLKLFKFKPGFNGTPEMFLAMVMELQSRNNKAYSVTEMLQWGEVMQQAVKVNLAPYRNFADLLQNGKPDFKMIERVRDKMDELNQRRELKQAIYGKDVDLGDDDVMTSNGEGAVFARKMVKNLAKHVKFKDEDQDMIDRL